MGLREQWRVGARAAQKFLAPTSRVLRRAIAIKPDAVVDRLFRYIEMLAVTAVIGTVVSVLDKGAGRVTGFLMGALAGVYIAVPITRWFEHLDAPRRFVPGRGFAAIMMTAMLAMTSAFYADLAVGVLRQTVQVDEGRAKQALKEWQRNMAEQNCIRGGTSWAQAEKCLARVERHFGPR